MATVIYSSFKLGEGAVRSGIKTIVDVPSHNLLAIASRDGIMRIITNTSKGSSAQIRTFDKHEGEIMLGRGLLHLTDDVLCSMDASGNIYTWSSAWGYVLDSIKLQTYFNLSYSGVFLKLSDTKLAIENGTNTIIILSHEQGKNLRVIDHLRVLDSDSSEIVDVAAHNDNLVVLDKEGHVSVWNYCTKTLLHKIKGAGDVGKVGINDWFIAIIYNGRGTFFMNGGEYAEVMRLDLNFTKRVNEITFPSPNYLMVNTSEAAVFISLIDGKITDQVMLKYKGNKHLQICSSSVMLDGRICIGSSDGYIAFFEPPENLRAEIKRFSEQIHNESTNASAKNMDSSVKNKEYKAGAEEHNEEIYNLKEELRFILEGNNKVQKLQNIDMQNLKEEQVALKLQMTEEHAILAKKTGEQESLQSTMNAEQESLKDRMEEMERSQKISGEKMKELATEIVFLKGVISGLLRK